MIKYGNDITCSGNAMTTSEFNGESSLQNAKVFVLKILIVLRSHGTKIDDLVLAVRVTRDAQTE